MLFVPEFPWSDLHTLNLDWLLSVVANHERQLQDIEGSASPYDEAPLQDGVADPGNVNQFARGNHRHPTDTTRASVAALQAVQDSVPGPSNGNPRMDGAANPGTYTYYSRADHVHPSDTSKLDKTGGEVTGLLDIVPRRSYGTLSNPGWYRVLTLDANNAALARGYNGQLLDINIIRKSETTYGEIHKISFMNYTDSGMFENESSKSGALDIDKIRYTYDATQGKGYIDIHYNASTSNGVTIDFDVHTWQLSKALYVSANPIIVADSPSGETVLAQYPFKDNSEHGTLTHVTRIDNNYFDASAINRCYYQFSGNWLAFHLHLLPSSSMPPSSDFVQIAKIPLPPNYALEPIAHAVPCQNGNGVLVVHVEYDGTVSVFNGTAANIQSFCRAVLMLYLKPNI